MKKAKNHTIAFIVNRFPSISETFILNQIIDLVERGYDVTIFSFHKQKQTFAHHAIGQYKLIEKTTYYHRPSGSWLRSLHWFIFFLLKNLRHLFRSVGFRLLSPRTLRKAIQQESISQSVADFLNRSNANIVHAHFGPRGIVVADLIERAKLRPFKFVVTFHGYDLIPAYVDRYKNEYKNLFRFADAVTVNSKYLEDILLTVCPNPKNLFLLPVGLRTAQYQKNLNQFDEMTKHCTVLFCGRFVEFKAPDLAVQIMDVLMKRGIRNIRLRMIGDGRLRHTVESLIEKLSLKDIVVLLGAKSQEQVINEMSKANIFLLPGIHEKATGRAETQGLVIQEAQAMRLPVIVSTAGGMPYGLLDGVSGFVVKEKDLEGFADKIQLLANNETMRKNMGEAGREFVVHHFDTRILGDHLLKIYSAI